MSRIDFAFQGLQPTVLLHAKGDDDVFGRNQIPFHVRQRWRFPGLRTRVGPYDAISLLTGIGFDLDTLFQAAASGSAGMSITAPVTSYFDP
jgi:hypothetical protein